LTVPADVIVEATGPNGALVSYTASASDLVDGEITPTCTPAPGSIFPLAVTTVICKASDTAGNTASASFLVTVSDTTPPTISASVSPVANAYGWRNSLVTVSFTCQDTASGIASCSTDQILGEGADQAVSGMARDNAGNTASTLVRGINVDLTAPVVSVTGVSNGETYLLGLVPEIGCETTDALSGVQTNATSSVTGGDAYGIGTITAHCTGAMDKAGNTGAGSVIYQVKGPIISGALSIGFWRNKNGQAIIMDDDTTNGVCNLTNWLGQYAPYQDLDGMSTCAEAAMYVTNIINSANAAGSSMNGMLKAQMLATLLDVYFSDPALGGNSIAAPAPVGGVRIDLTKICTSIDTASGIAVCGSAFQDVAGAFGGASGMTVSAMLTYSSQQSNVGGSLWYGQNKATQELAKNAFDCINNQAAFTP
jgi:hypothetical protein